MCIKSHVNPAMSSYVEQTGITTTNRLQNQMITEHRIEFKHDFD